MTDVRSDLLGDPFVAPERTTPIGLLLPRRHAAIDGTVEDVRLTHWAGAPVLQLELVDVTGALHLVLLGRRRIAGIASGTRLTAAGTPGWRSQRLLIVNPQIWLHARSETRARLADAATRLPGLSPSDG